MSNLCIVNVLSNLIGIVLAVFKSPSPVPPSMIRYKHEKVFQMFHCACNIGSFCNSVLAVSF